MKQMLNAGYYVSKIKLNVVKTLSVNLAKDGTAKRVERVYGSWATDPNNMISFEPDVKVYLTEQDVALPNIRTLIETGQLTRSY